MLAGAAPRLHHFAPPNLDFRGWQSPGLAMKCGGSPWVRAEVRSFGPFTTDSTPKTAWSWMSNQVVAHFRDGKVLKGISLDIDPEKPAFHVRPPQGKAVEAKLSDLKALFFVRSLEGNKSTNDQSALDPKDTRTRGSTAIKVRFDDGETIAGLTIRFPPNKPYFFIVPADPKSNNLRILINKSAVVAMEKLAEPGAKR